LGRAKRSLQSCGTDDIKTLAYMAGFFDAEGCVRIQKNRNDKANYTLKCCIKQSDKVPLELISLYFGGSVFPTWTRINHQKMWEWSCTTRYASKFLKSIEPYLITKKAEAMLAGEFQNSMITRRAGKINKVSECELAVREAQRILMQNLKNKKDAEMLPNNIGKAKRDLSNLTNADEAKLSYIAGFFDGEGTISIHQGDKKYPSSYTLSCGISQIDKSPLEFVALYFGGNVHPKKTKATPYMWTWACSARYALVFLKAIEPYLIIKKAQAIVAISFQTRMASTRKGKRKYITSYEIAVREAERILLRKLKREKSTELPIIKVKDNIQGVLL
jgi:hypothetical protein